MKTYLISYDLNSPGQDYESLFSAIRELGSTWWHNLDSTWIIRYDGSAAQIRDALSPLLDPNDELIVVGLTGEGAWKGLTEKGANWLLKNL